MGTALTHDCITKLSPALKNEYWRQIISRETRPHRVHCLNTTPEDFKTFSGRSVGKEDFYEEVWQRAVGQYHKAAGAPSAFLKMAHARHFMCEQAKRGRSIEPEKKSARSARSNSTKPGD